MFSKSMRIQELEARAAAIDRSQAVIEFDTDGTILWANQNFLQVVGYTLEEIKGQHHRLFVHPGDREGAEYRQFWQRLKAGQYQVAEYRRVRKSGEEIWLQASYNPVLDRHGRPIKVVKFATDVTATKLRNAEFAGKIAAIDKSQAVIEFALDGTILAANQNFLAALGYRLDEIRGRHHRMFVTPEERDSAAYQQFWQRLGSGEYQAAEYMRIGNGGREVWIQASYNPILDLGGNPFKIVKFATDITAAKRRAAGYEAQIDAIGKSQAVIEFDLDGTILTANRNFLEAVGYGLAEVQGKHHSIFIAPDERAGAAYRQFWADLAGGQYKSGEFYRIGKNGREIWIQGSYNPILDLNGRPIKVVKVAIDITDQVLRRRRSEYVGSLMETVAAGAEELNASVKEIAQSMSRSRETADGAVARVRTAEGATARLTDAAQSMNGILALITSITSQINLLALNATIEAARAGEAGRGFAVVATEVKNLAAKARSATEEISREITGMREISQEVVGGLDSIQQAIELVRDYISSTASAAEQQSGVTAEMSSSMQKAAMEANRLR